MVQSVGLYLDEPLLDTARAGQLPVARVLKEALTSIGWRLALRPLDPDTRLRSADLPDFSVFHRADPFHGRALCLRRAYMGEVWRLERTAERHRFAIARAEYRPGDPVRARRLANEWRQRIYGQMKPFQGKDYVYVALQEQLLVKRSFQSCAPIDMVRATLEHERDLPVVIGMHPGGSYSDEENDALADLLLQYDRLHVSELPAPDLLKGAAYVVTQNSAVGFAGLVAHVPVVAFAKTDYHHITSYVPRLGVEAAFEDIWSPRPDFDTYIHWFLTHQSVQPKKSNAVDRMLQILHRRGWPI